MVCGSTCTSTLDDERSCGTCGNVCSVVCSGGTCTQASDLGASYLTSCVSAQNGDVLCWGFGRSSLDVAPTPRRGDDLVGVRQFATSGSHHCGILADGTLWCWGSRFYGQVGDGLASSTPRATPGMILSGVQQVAVWDESTSTTESSHLGATCAAMLDGTARCWGHNGSGRLGDGTTLNRATPVFVGDLTDVTKVALGNSFACALRSSGRVSCWGSNVSGRLGQPLSVGQSTTPLEVPDLTDAVDLALGRAHACAVRATGAVACWGENSQGQLGDGTFTSRSMPLDAAAITTAVQVATGGDHTCVRRADGTLRCWGQNSSGQLGDGTFTRTPWATANPGLTAVAQVSAGSIHTCARLESGDVRCWGANANSQVGDGSFTVRSVPTAVRW